MGWGWGTEVPLVQRCAGWDARQAVAQVAQRCGKKGNVPVKQTAHARLGNVYKAYCTGI
jgi:hypothetical protein